MSLPDDHRQTKEPPTFVPFDEQVAWERWPLREDPGGWLKLVLLLALALVVGAVLVVSLPVTAAVALGLALVVTLLPYVLPRRFEVSETGIAVRQGFYSIHRVWPEIESYQKLANGFLLDLKPKEGTRPRPNLLASNSKELFLPFPLEPEKLSPLEGIIIRHIPNN